MVYRHGNDGNQLQHAATETAAQCILFVLLVHHDTYYSTFAEHRRKLSVVKEPQFRKKY